MRIVLAALLSVSLVAPTEGMPYRDKGKKGQIKSVDTPRRPSDGRLLKEANTVGPDGYTPVGRWFAKDPNEPLRLLPAEVNVYARSHIERLFASPDRENLILRMEKRVILQVESATLNYAARFSQGKFEAFTKELRKPHKHKYGDYKIEHPDTITKSTPEEIRLAEAAKKVPPEIAKRLREQGFRPINEIAGGTPMQYSNYEGWMKPFTDGTKTWPETD